MLRLVRRSVTHYWRGNLVVVFGVAAAVAVLAGALVVGDSVRGTLRDLALGRLGSTDVAVISAGFFRDALATELAADAEFQTRFRAVAPMLAVEGFVTAQSTGRRAGRVRVYGIDDRFWQLHGQETPRALEPRQALVSPALAEETGAERGSPILVRVELPSDIPIESLHGRKDDPGRTVRATVEGVLPADRLGEFSLAQEQGRIRAVFLPIEWLRDQLEVGATANVLMVAGRDGTSGGADALTPLLQRLATPEDAGLTLRTVPEDRTVVVSSTAGLIDDAKRAAVMRAAAAASLPAEPVFTYLANTIRVGAREVPYSLVTARELNPAAAARSPEISGGGAADPLPPIVFNTWLARELAARVGDRVELDYYAWVEPGRLVTRQAAFQFAGVRPIGVTDREFAPIYPGITDSPTLDDWDPPFPLDLSRVRPADEAYWTEYRTTPKAFIPIADGERLWGSRHGHVTSVRVAIGAERELEADATSFRQALTRELGLAAGGIVVRDVRQEALAASAGATDFGEYFIYFSFFIVASALVLAALFFKLGVDERAREIGVLGAMGARNTIVRRMFLIESCLLAGLGALLGAAAAVGYAAALIFLLRTLWIDAVGTSALALHVRWSSVAIGAAGGVVAALVCTWLSVRHLGRLSPRQLVAGVIGPAVSPDRERGQRLRLAIALLAVVLALSLAWAARAGAVGAATAFFGGALLMLTFGLTMVAWWYRRGRARVLTGRGWAALVALGLRNSSTHPGRSALAVSVIASAVFILLAVDVFRKGAVADTGPASGLGGYTLVAESLLPIAHDLGDASGREALGLPADPSVRLDGFRLRPGDDASCLNLYQPSNPRILGVRQAFIDRGRFAFRTSLASSDAERANPWLLLAKAPPDGAVPVVADANSLTYVLHKAVGDTIEVPHSNGPVRLRVVASLSDSLFQGELLMSEANFIALFPEHEGYRLFLGETTGRSVTDVATEIEDRLSAFGVDAVPAMDRLAEFHRVENTYLGTFQTLGGLGLLLGTIGLSAVLLRNVVERRRELALLAAVGYEPADIRLILLAESASLLVLGLVIGAAAAAVASAPAYIERGGRLPISVVGFTVVGAVLVAGLASTALAARAATRQPLLSALRSE
jgi:ABC-type lipoprotein release transport system permease subunit